MSPIPSPPWSLLDMPPPAQPQFSFSAGAAGAAADPLQEADTALEGLWGLGPDWAPGDASPLDHDGE